MKGIKKALACVLVGAFALTGIAACGKTSNTSDTINFYLWNDDGKMPTGFQTVVDKYNSTYASEAGGLKLNFKFDTLETYKQNLNLYFSSKQETYDVVYDAQWIYLDSFASKNYYYNLTSYFNNDNYPGLKKAFQPDYIDNNEFNGGVYGIPSTESFGDLAVTYIRKDWRIAAAADTTWTKPESITSNKTSAANLSDGIDNFDEFEYYMYWVKAHAGKNNIPANVVEFSCNKDGNYSPYEIISKRTIQSKLPSDKFADGIKDDIRINDYLNGTAYLNREDEVEAAYVDNQLASAANGKSQFPAGYTSEDTSWQENYAIARRWEQDGLLGDVANETEAYAKFQSGTSAATMESISKFSSLESSLKTAASSSQLEIFVHDKSLRDKKNGVIATDYKAWNFLCIPESVSSAKVPKIMKFFDWLFASQEHHDLFQYGIKGTNWTEAKDAGGNTVADTVTTAGMEAYNFSAYLLTWNPNYIRVQYASDPKVMEYSLYMYDIHRYVAKLYPGFTYSISDCPQTVQTALASTDVATAKSQVVAYKLGLINDPVSQWAAYQTSLNENTNLQSALNSIQQDLIRQLNAYITANPA